MACSHTHMFATCLITCLSIKRYQFAGRDMPLQKSSGVAILVSLQECGIFRPRTVHRETNSEKPQVKIRFAFHFVERNNFWLHCIIYICSKKFVDRKVKKFNNRNAKAEDSHPEEAHPLEKLKIITKLIL